MKYMMFFFRKMPFSVRFTGVACLFLSCFTGPLTVFADDSEILYKQAEKCHERLLKSSLKRRFRQFWFPCLNYYKKVYTNYPDGPWAAAGLYRSGQLYLEFYQQFKKEEDQTAGLNNFKKIIETYPDSPYKIKAEASLKSVKGKPAPKSGGKVIEMPLDDDTQQQPSNKITAKSPSKGALPETSEKQSERQKKSGGSVTPDTADRSSKNETRSALDQIRRKIAGVGRQKSSAVEKSSATGRKVTVSKVQYSSSPNHTRVVIHAGAPSVYHYHLLEKDPALDTPQRLYVDIENARLGAQLRRKIMINDQMLFNARTGQFTSDVVRVVMDLKHVKDYKVFSLHDPFRIVIDYRNP